MTIEGQNLSVKSQGHLELAIAEPITVARNEDGAIIVTRPDDDRRSRCCTGCRGRPWRTW